MADSFNLRDLRSAIFETSISIKKTIRSVQNRGKEGSGRVKKPEKCDEIKGENERKGRFCWLGVNFIFFGCVGGVQCTGGRKPSNKFQLKINDFGSISK